MPNVLRDLAQGEPLYSSFVDLWADDVSANRTKAWNKHENVCIVHSNIPRKLNQQEFHVHFVSSSPNATATEQFCALKAAVEYVYIDYNPRIYINETFRRTHAEPLRVPDPFRPSQFCRLRIFAASILSDNPMQSTECSHIGGNGSFDCRKCMRGGSELVRVSKDGYHKLFEVQSVLSPVGPLSDTWCIGPRPTNWHRNSARSKGTSRVGMSGCQVSC